MSSNTLIVLVMNLMAWAIDSGTSAISDLIKRKEAPAPNIPILIDLRKLGGNWIIHEEKSGDQLNDYKIEVEMEFRSGHPIPFDWYPFDFGFIPGYKGVDIAFDWKVSHHSLPVSSSQYKGSLSVGKINIQDGKLDIRWSECSVSRMEATIKIGEPQKPKSKATQGMHGTEGKQESQGSQGEQISTQDDDKKQMEEMIKEVEDLMKGYFERVKYIAFLDAGVFNERMQLVLGGDNLILRLEKQH